MILVTGATGFVGSHLVRRLVSDGNKVRILRREGSRLDVLGGVLVEEVIGDITDADFVSRAVNGCEVVFHSAAFIQYWDPKNDEQTQINVGGTRNVVEACIRHYVKRLVHVSSIAAVGYVVGGLADEATVYNGGSIRNNYCDTKYAAEVVVRDGISRGLDAVIVNPGTIYGPADRRRIGYIRGLAGWFTAGGGMAVVDVDDVVEGMIAAWKKGRSGERYILIAENHTFKEIGRMLANELGHGGPRIVLPGWCIRLYALAMNLFSCITRRSPTLTPSMARLANIRCFYSNEKAKNELGIRFRPFKETIRRTIAWYRQNGYI